LLQLLIEAAAFTFQLGKPSTKSIFRAILLRGQVVKVLLLSIEARNPCFWS
jgi:hypothetical protein